MCEKNALEPPKLKNVDDSNGSVGGAEPGRCCGTGGCSSSSYTVELSDDAESTDRSKRCGASLLCGDDAADDLLDDAELDAGPLLLPPMLSFPPATVAP